LHSDSAAVSAPAPESAVRVVDPAPMIGRGDGSLRQRAICETNHLP